MVTELKQKFKELSKLKSMTAVNQQRNKNQLKELKGQLAATITDLEDRQKKIKNSMKNMKRETENIIQKL
jgi:hypothetical protein